MRKQCAVCGAPFDTPRSSAKFCGDRCRQRAHRRPAAAVAVVEPVELVSGGLLAATLAELDGAGRVESSAGQAALALATRIDANRGETGSSLAALVREHRVTLADAVQGAARAADPLDELRLRRARKLNAG